jgi:hypothetical protein
VIVPTQQAQHPVELIEACIVKRQRTTALFWLEGDAQPEHRPELAFERHSVRVTRTAL